MTHSENYTCPETRIYKKCDYLCPLKENNPGGLAAYTIPHTHQQLMKRFIAITLAAAMTAAASAQINSPGADGFFTRGIAMYNDRNYNGCIDQLAQLSQFTITPSQREESTYYMGMALLHSGDDEAIDVLKDFLTRYPQSPRFQDATMSAGDYFFTRGAYEDALEWYDEVSPKALTSDRAAELRYRRAYSLMMLRRYTEARPIFAQLTGDAEYGNAANYYLAYMAYDEGSYAEALALFKKVDTTREPGTAAPYYMSQIYFLNGDYSRALDLALKVLQNNPVPDFAPEANRIAGESFYNMGQTERALPYLWRYAAESADPQPSALYILGVSEYESGNTDNAVTLFQKATRADGKIGQAAWLYLGQSYVKQGNHDGALLSFEKAYRNGSDPAVTESAFYNYIVARTEGGRMPFANTVGMLEEFLTKYPKSRYAATVQESLIDGYMTDGDYESALSAIKKIKNPSKDVIAARQRVLFELGRREYQAGHPSDAATLLQDASTGPSADISRQARLWLADCDYELGRYDRAAEAYLAYTTSAGATDANRTLAYYNLGYTRYKQGRYADAISDFRRVIDATDNRRMLADSYNRIADCLYQQHDFDQAAVNYQRAFEKDPSAGDYALYQLAVMRGLQDSRTDQIRSLDQLITDYPSSSLVAAAILDKADAYAAMGQTDKAIDTYRDLARSYSGSSYGRQACLQLAITQLNAGKRNDAIDTYRQIVYSYPTSEEARLAVDDLKRIYAADGRLEELNAFLASVPNSPRLSASELDQLAFQAAENMYLNSGKSGGIQAYLADYPHGAYEAQAYYYLADSSAEAGDLKKALEYTSEVVLNHPDSEVADDAMLLKADIEARQGKGEIALDTYRTLEKRASGSRIVSDARMGIMRTALSLGRYSEVLVATDKLKASTAAGAPDLPEIRFSEAQALDRLGRNSEAYTIWRELAKQPDNLFGARSAVSLGQSLYDKGKTTEASSVINKFINANSPHQYWQARAFILLSDILRRQGKEFEADEYLQALRSNYPGSEKDIFDMVDQRLNK